MWDLPRPGLEPVSPALAGRFSTTAPPGKPPLSVCSDHLLITRLVKEGSPALNSMRWLNMWQLTLGRWGRQQFINHLHHSPGWRTPHTRKGHAGAALGSRVNKQWLSEAGFVVTRRWGDLWFPCENVIGLSEQIFRLSGRWNPLAWGCGQRISPAVSVNKDVVAFKSSATAATPDGAPWGDSRWRKTGYWP